jgi:rRNA maturation RNase YbeY
MIALVDFSNKTNFKISEKFFSEIISKYLSNLKKTGKFQISLSLVSDRKIQKLNQKYLKRNHPTDVLSFSTEFPKIKTAFQYLGEIVIAYPYIKKQANEQSHSIKKELEILTIHGLNHLLGKHHA